MITLHDNAGRPTRLAASAMALAVALTLAVRRPGAVRSLVVVEPPPWGTAGAAEFRQATRGILEVARGRDTTSALDEVMHLVDGDGVLRRAEVAHADPAKAPLARDMRSILLGPGWATPGAQAIRDRTPRIYSRLTEELMAWATWDDRHLAALRATVPNSMIAVPLVAHGTAIGALTLLRSGSSPPFWGEDLRKSTALATPAGLALDIARKFAAKGGRPTSPAPGRRRPPPGAAAAPRAGRRGPRSRT